MKKLLNNKFIKKFLPIIFAAIVAIVQTIMDQKQTEQIDNFEERIKKLEEEHEKENK